MSNNNNLGFLAILILAIGTIGAFVLVLAFAYLVVSGLWYLICLGLGIQFSWFAALGIFAICLLLRWVISAAKPNK